MGYPAQNASKLGTGSFSATRLRPQSSSGSAGARLAGTTAELIAGDDDHKTLLAYQGRAIKAGKVGYMDGTMTIRPGLDMEGGEELFCDAEGIYYLRRVAHRLDYYGVNQREASGRERVHRLSRRAAVLWATMRCNAVGWELRNDVNSLLDASEAVANRPSADRLLDGRSRELLIEELTNDPERALADMLNGAVEFLLGDPEQDGASSSGEALAWAKQRRLEDGESLTPSVPFALDDRAGLLLQDYLAARPSRNALDVINGAVAYMLADEANFPGVIDDAEARREAHAGATDASVQSVLFGLEPLHARLLEHFTRKHGISAAQLTQAALIDELECLYNGDDREEEPAAVRWLREHGRLNSLPSKADLKHMQAVLGAGVGGPARENMEEHGQASQAVGVLTDSPQPSFRPNVTAPWKCQRISRIMPSGLGTQPKNWSGFWRKTCAPSRRCGSCAKSRPRKASRRCLTLRRVFPLRQRV